MEADTLVATALCALDQGERVCFPTSPIRPAGAAWKRRAALVRR